MQTLAHAVWVDLGRHAVQWGVMLLLGAVYFILQYLLTVPGCPRGYIGGWMGWVDGKGRNTILGRGCLCVRRGVCIGW